MYLDTLRKQVQNQVFSCPGKKINPYISMSRTPDASLVSRSKIQKKATQMSGFFLSEKMSVFMSIGSFRPILLKNRP